VTAAPPWTLRCPVVTITRPPPPAIGITLRPPPVIAVLWPVLRVAQGEAPAPPGVIHLGSPPQGPWRLAFPNGHALRNPGLYDLPPRRG
jgi:hypothetical protein